MVPTREYPRQSAPKPTYEIDRRGAIVYDSLTGVERELFEGVAHDQPLCDWLADYIERDRFDRFSDAIPGVGAVTAQKLYDEYRTLANVHAAPFDELDDQLRTKSVEAISALSV